MITNIFRWFSARMLWVCIIFLHFSLEPGTSTAISPRRISRNVKIDWDSTMNQPVVSWPEGIKFVANSRASKIFTETRRISSEQFSNAPYDTMNSPPEVSVTGNIQDNSAVTRLAPKRRTYTWEKDELLISCNLTALANPTCTRLIPPITWMSASGSRCKVLHSNPFTPASMDDSIIEIGVVKDLAEGSLSALRMQGFKREDIYRMLDKGPWVLAFDVSKTLPKLMSDLESDLYLNRTEAVHVVSHCPFLIAQYARYKGRDVYTTVHSLLEVGYDRATLMDDIMRFPSMLAAPPDRLKGWMALLGSFNVAKESGLFGKLLKRAPFMFYINPPSIWNFGEEDEEDLTDDVSTTASAFVVTGALRVLQHLSTLQLPDLDKVVRTQPYILLCSEEEVVKRCNFLLNLFLEQQNRYPLIDCEQQPQSAPPLATATPDPDLSISSTNAPSRSSKAFPPFERSIDVVHSASAVETRSHARSQLGSLLMSFPSVLSIDFEQMRSAGNSLRAAGMRRADVVQLARRHPPLLARPAADLMQLCAFLRTHVGVRKSELVPLLLKYPAILSADVSSLAPKVEYLKRGMRGTPAMLKRYPSYFSFDLDTHIRPRTEFLRAVGLDPLINGLPFLVTAQPADLSYAAGMSSDVFSQFKVAFGDMWRKKLAKEKAAKQTAAAQSARTGTVVGKSASAAESVNSSPSSASTASSTISEKESDGPSNPPESLLPTLPFGGEGTVWSDDLARIMEEDVLEAFITDAFDEGF